MKTAWNLFAPGRIGLALAIAAGVHAATILSASSAAADDAETSGPASAVFESGALEQLARDLNALVEPMAQKVDACDHEVVAATRMLAELEDQLAAATADVQRGFREIQVLASLLQLPECEIRLGDRRFDRELAAALLETKIDAYRRRAPELLKLREELGLQQRAVAEAVAKRDRWKAKERELREQVAEIAAQHPHVVGDAGELLQRSLVRRLAALQGEVQAMLDAAQPATPTDAASSDDASPALAPESVSATAESSHAAAVVATGTASDAHAPPATAVLAEVEQILTIDLDASQE